ncbi:MAG: PrsW family intramembrane metalloprotease [Firmicutes bacterium]|nr:PrsW family intramembrane metalloprotease [Bacillota bacterium]
MPYIILAAVLPGLFWVWYFQRRDPYDREPWPMLLKAGVFGAVAVLPAIALEYPFRSFLQGEVSWLTAFWVSFGVVGVGEELVKMVAVYAASYSSEHFNEPVDGIIYAVTAGLGFSVVENVLYISSFGLSIAPLRAVVASLAHASFSGIAGYYVGRAKFSPNPWGELALGLFWSAILHGVYDFVLITQLVSPLWIVVGVGGSHYFLLRLIAHQLPKTRIRL